MTTFKLYVIGAAAAIVVAAGICFWFYHKGGEAEQVAQVKTAVKVKVKQDEVRNNRPDVPAVVDSLLDARF